MQRTSLVLISAVGILTAACVPPPSGPSSTTTVAASLPHHLRITTTTSTVPQSGGGECSGTGTPPATWDHVALIIFAEQAAEEDHRQHRGRGLILTVAKACSYATKFVLLELVSLAMNVAGDLPLHPAQRGRRS